MYTRSLKAPSSSFFLFGARGTGKSTWLRKNFKDAQWFNFLDETLFQKLLVSPEHFHFQIKTLKPESWVVVDEVQRLPNLLNEVQRGIEEYQLNFALTGSSARKLKRAGVNLLAGRARLRSMLPFLPQELGDDFDIEKILRWGAVPLIWNSKEPDETLKDYVQIYLKEEIKSEALVRNLAGFARSLPVVALFNSQIMNISSLARDAEVERKTAEGYIQILEDTLLLKKLHAYQAKITVRERQKPKLYWVDPGIARAAKGMRGPLAIEERGGLFESYIYQMIRHEIENSRKYEDVYYWSPSKSKTEVDFLLKGDRGFVAIEAKSSLKVRKDHFKGLNAIKELKGLKRRVLLYLGTERMKTEDGIEVLPVRDFESELVNGFSVS